MGCGSSKATQVVPASQAWDSTQMKANAKDVREGSSKSRKSRKSSGGKSAVKRLSGSTSSIGSLDSSSSDRENRLVSSATSKSSNKSGDSGLGEDYAKVITEDSDPNDVRQVETDRRPKTPDFELAGQAISRTRSGKQRSEDILRQLQQEGLVRPKTSGGGRSLAFEVQLGPGNKLPPVNQLPPPRLAKLERRRKKKKLTKEELEEKMRRAEERRQKKEQEVREKAIQTRIKESTHNPMAVFAEQQKELAEKVEEKVNEAEKKREAHLKALRDRLRQKEEHAKKVREAKLKALENPPQDMEIKEDVAATS
ncbi:STMN3 [Branchiostoma lanceolatum]|uniref:STMN3 protein n=1 Tax=Branchiostoma lanceolatum TaxID=7740 RepID=A0A8K0EJV5_BRALA|nr:STMN3 [Branchiostoma lanceolatum]